MEEEEDRISQLPGHILDNVLSFLSQDDAVRTCLLSKSWRHLGPTRPKIEFHETTFFPRGKQRQQKFMSVFENTLQRYADRKLSIQELILEMSPHESSNNNLIHKWILKLHMLKRLELCYVHIEEETFEKIMSSCPLIEHLVLKLCLGMSTIKVRSNLKHFDCSVLRDSDRIEINDAPYLETIRISGPSKNWHHLHIKNNYFFPRLKSLYLGCVRLPAELLNSGLSSNNCPCLEKLQLHFCTGFTEFRLSSRSMKRLIINMPDQSIEAVDIDAANMLYFEFESNYLPSSVSFAAAKNDRCKSRVKVSGCYSGSFNARVFSTWLLELREFLEAMSQISQISLDVSCLSLTKQYAFDDGNYSCEPVVVEHLYLRAYYEAPTLLNCMLRICHPRYIGVALNGPSQKSVSKMILRKEEGEKRQSHFWQQDLEESSIHVFDKNTNEWPLVQDTEPSNDQWLRLKWRDLS